MSVLKAFAWSTKYVKWFGASIFHSSEDTENLKIITGSWQQRVWEAEMFADPDVIQFLKDEKVIFTNWKEIMERFNEGVVRN
ncbi:hypothetical protein [Tunicatimonas pelagia]|uniref:hypothetical protein n=1 Tax=Tunicatimonas pelagia TaxID=931531 RepID=UPI00266683E5|nr:hypothetical protein [Tunicatimonas pelagia]WKN42090.1 hypothetical protein P0M28_23925 [Tunicatimonas pelagia]